MGPRPEGDAMVEVQGIVHVQSRVPPTAEQDDCLPVCYDSVCVLGVCGNGSSVRYANPRWTSFTTTLTLYSRDQTMSRSRILFRGYIAPPEFTTTTSLVLPRTTSLWAFTLRRYLDRDSSSIYSGPRDMRASLSGLPGNSAVYSPV
jgi:hypothetical protein